MFNRFTSIQPAGRWVNQRRKRSSARFNSRCGEDHSDVNSAEPGNVLWLRTRMRDMRVRETCVASIA